MSETIGKRKYDGDDVDNDSSTIVDSEINQPATKKQKMDESIDKYIETTEALLSKEIIQTTETIPATQIVLPIQITETMPPTEIVQATETMPPTEIVQATETVETTETIQPKETILTIENVPTLEVTETKQIVKKSANYEQHECVPFDLKYMLERFCCKEHDTIWIPFATSNAFSVRYVKHLGYKLIESTQEEFFTCQQAPPMATIIVTDAQFSKKRQVLQKLMQLNLPFVVVQKSDTMQRDFFVTILKSSIKTHRWLVEMPTKTLFFHSNGTILPMPRYKTAFFSCQPIQQQNSNNEIATNDIAKPTNEITGEIVTETKPNEQTKNETKSIQICLCLRNKHIKQEDSSDKQDTLSLINVKLVDYAALRRAAGILICNRPFETTCENNLGKMIPQPRKKRQATKRSKLQQPDKQSQQPEGATNSSNTPTSEQI